MSSNTPSDPEPTYQPPASSPSAPPAAPAYGAPSGYAPAPPPAHDAAAPKPKGSSTLGIIALAAAAVGVIVGAILGFIGGQQVGSLIEFTGTSGQSVTPGSLPPAAEQIALTGGVLSTLAFVVYGILGLWGFIQGIIATVKNRGRGWGIAAIVVAVIGGVIVAGIWGAGFTAGAAPYLA